jgi:hypothetical protein
MTLQTRSFGSVLLLVLAWGCGGKVVVDGEPDGSGGSPGTTGSDTTSSSVAATATSTGTGASNVTCDLLCGGPIGLCACSGQCSDGNMRAIGCGLTDGGPGAACSCLLNDQLVGMCDDPSLSCGLPQSCCQGVFGL